MAEHRELTAEELDRVLTWSVVRVARFAGQRLAERLAAHGLNPIHFGVLAYLVIAPEMTQADLARAVLVRPQSIAPPSGTSPSRRATSATRDSPTRRAPS